MYTQPQTPRLFRSRTNVMLSGVAGGIAEYFNIDPTIARVLLFLLLLLTTGPFGIIVYFILASIIPQAPVTEQMQ